MKISSRGKPAFSQFHHVGVVVRDIDKAINYLSSLGIGPFEPPWPEPPLKEKMFRGKPAHYKMKMSNGMMGETRIELIQPVEGESTYKEFLDNQGDGIHHIGFAVNDLDSEVAKLTKQGMKVLTSGRWMGGGFAYLHAETFSGIIMELFQE